MKHFWEQSPEWQRQQELGEAYDAAEKARREAGWVLSFVLHDAVAPSGAAWGKARADYKEACEAWKDAGDAWWAAVEAFRASPAGQARARYSRDPLATPAEEIAA